MVALLTLRYGFSGRQFQCHPQMLDVMCTSCSQQGLSKMQLLSAISKLDAEGDVCGVDAAQIWG
jgi:hypothetical protein